MFFIRRMRCILQISSEWYQSLPCRPGFVVGSGGCGWPGHWFYHERKNFICRTPTSSEYTGIYYIEGISSSVTLSPTLVDPARVSVIRAVDGQDTGLCAQLAEEEEPTSDQHRPGLSPSERTGTGFSAFKASADRPAQKNATSDVISTKLVT